MRWVVFVGSVDDTIVGAPGLYHWFEHIPFRGTKKFPGGQRDLFTKINRMGGSLNAHTTDMTTVYEVIIPLREWRHGLELITDLAAQPLLREEDVEKERKIIFQEIVGHTGTVDGYVHNKRLTILADNHPFGHCVLGDEVALNSMSAEMLVSAYRLGYDRCRMALVVCGGMGESELVDEVLLLSDTLPQNKLTARTSGVYRGDLPQWPATDVVEDIPFTESVTSVLFPRAGASTYRKSVIASIANSMFGYGGLSSPLLRILREDRNLVYSADVNSDNYLGGGFTGFRAKSKKENISLIMQAFRDVLDDPETRSIERFELIKEGKQGEIELQPFDPDVKTGECEDELLNPFGVHSDDEYFECLKSVAFEEVLEAMKVFNPDKMRTIIFKGIG